MKKLIAIAIIFLLPFCTEARNLWAFLTYGTFNSPEGAYVETYLSVAGNSVTYIKKPNGMYQATVYVLMTFKLNGDIKAFKKYELNSPEIPDTSKVDYEFIDEQRFQLENGTYEYSMEIYDKNRPSNASPFVQPLTIDFPSDKPSFSSIQLVKSYVKSETVKPITKSGFDLVPYIYNFYPGLEKKIIFYTELYNMTKVFAEGEKYILNYYIESVESKLKFFEYARMKKATVKSIDVLLSEFNIEGLATGNYNLVVEARNQQNEVIASQRVFFQRSNPKAVLSYDPLINQNPTGTFAERITNMDTLREYISSTFPISSGLERVFVKDVVKSSKSLADLQRYFFTFWVNRDPVNPEKAWLTYREQVKLANVLFKTPVKKGYQTDRGRVFLEYGPPNTRSERPSEPTSYPYEIWQYYTLANTQRNKKFVFYSPDMVTNDYFLLHSDAIGEIYNDRWQVDLQSRTYSPIDISETRTINSWGEMSKDYWELPN